MGLSEVTKLDTSHRFNGASSVSEKPLLTLVSDRSGIILIHPDGKKGLDYHGALRDRNYDTAVKLAAELRELIEKGILSERPDTKIMPEKYWDSFLNPTPDMYPDNPKRTDQSFGRIQEANVALSRVMIATEVGFTFYRPQASQAPKNQK